MKRKLKKEYSTLESIKSFLETKTDLSCSIMQDEWLTDGKIALTPGKKCILIKKSNTAGAKVNLLDSNIVDVRPVAPGRFINTLTQRGFIAIAVHLIIAGGQNKIANEIEAYLMEIEDK